MRLSEKDLKRFEAKINYNGRQTEYVDTPCHEWMDRPCRGYGHFYIYENGKGIALKAHRVSYQIHNNIVLPSYDHSKKDYQINHLCHNKMCVRIEHLYLGDQADNIKDMQTSGRLARGEKIHTLKLNPEIDIPLIREYFKQGMTNQWIADRFGLNQSTISRIRTGKIHHHIP